MKVRGRHALAAVLVLLLSASSVQPQRSHPTQTPETELEVLPEAVFQARYGTNPDVPRTDEEILALAEKLFPFTSREPGNEVVKGKTCGEPDLALLMAGLQNPAISDHARQAAQPPPPPPLEKTRRLGHFKIRYTTVNTQDRRHNVTSAQIETLALALNHFWDEYYDHFKRMPKYYVDDAGRTMVDILVYYLPTSHGMTLPTWKYIILDSLTVRDQCLGQVTAAHELFHRVQYQYGYTGMLTNAKWMSEGTAVWVQKWVVKEVEGSPNHIIGDYVESVNEGLQKPDRNLLAERKEDSCHLWLYLEDRTDWTAILDVWKTFKTNGFNAKAAVDSVVTARLGLTFDKFLHKWSKANYIKGLANATPEYDYWEDDRIFENCRQQYGPLDRIMPVRKKILNNNAAFTLSGKVSPYGADYYALLLGTDLTNLSVAVTGADAGDFSYYFQGVKKNRGLNGTVLQTFNKTATYKKTMQSGEWDYLLLMVMGRSAGGDYTINVGRTDCMTGLWALVEQFPPYPPSQKLVRLTQNGTTLTGEVLDDAPDDFKVSGTYTPPNFVLNLTQDPLPSYACNVTYTGTITNCNSGSGTWSNYGNDICHHSNTWTMTRVEPGAIPSEAVHPGPTAPTDP